MAQMSRLSRRRISSNKALKLDQALAVLAAARGSRLSAYLVLSLLSGVRTEEPQPFTWDHVYLAAHDEVPPHVPVWRSVRRHGDTKPLKSRRTIALPKQVAQVLEEYLRRQKLSVRPRGWSGRRRGSSSRRAVVSRWTPRMCGETSGRS